MTDSPGIDRFELALRFLRWPARIDQGLLDLRAVRASEWLRQFCDHLRYMQHGQHLDVIERTAESFFSECRHLVSWWQAVLREGDIEVRLFDREPRIELRSLARWREAVALLDHDALLTLALTERHPEPEDASLVTEALSDWHIFPAVYSPTLERGADLELADTHVHFEASDPIPILWLRLMQDDVRLEAIPRYSRRAFEEIERDRERCSRRDWECGLIREACEFRRHKVAAAYVGKDRVPLVGRTASTRQRLDQERLFLLYCWRQALRHPASSFVRRFDRYLIAKSVFLSEQQQFPGSGAGLSRFRQYLDRGRSLTEARAARTSKRAQYQRMERLVDLAFESRRLNLIELRIAPRKTMRDWLTFFRLWERLLQRHDKLQSKQHQVGFVVHFIRQIDVDPRQVGEKGRFGALRARLDRESALLHLFRHRYPEQAAHIVGLDVANLERGCPPDVFVPFLRLLRGEDQLLADSGRRRIPLPAWDRLREAGQHRHSVTLPRLGQTYHVGEDFHHLLTGLRHIDFLAEHLLSDRDRIGHGLALGLEPVEWMRDNWNRMDIPKGVLLDDVVWLRHFLMEGGRLSNRHAWQLERLASSLCREVYGEALHLTLLSDVAAERRDFPPPRDWGLEEDRHDPVRRLYWMETWDREVVQKRSQVVAHGLLADIAQLVEVIAAAQELLCKKCAARGLVIEANPTSNMATGAVERMVDHPLFRILELSEDRARITINTDDPGVFATRIDQELAMVFAAHLKRNGNHLQRADQFLSRLRKEGRDSSFLRPRA